MRVNDAYDYLIYLIACAIHNEVPDPLPEGVTYEQVLSCAIRHDVAGFAFLGVMKAEHKPDSKTLDRWRQRYFIGIRRDSEQRAAREELLKELHSEGIATLELQGTRVKQYYPSPDLRMMGDIDIIIEKENIPDSEKILKKLGYRTVNQGGYEIDGERKGTAVEIHTDFFTEDCSFHEIIQNPFQFAETDEHMTAAVDNSIFLTYHLLHCLKHFYSTGIGIRRVLDLYFLKNEMEKTADIEYINNLLSEHGFAEDMKDLCAIAGYWFDGIETDRDIDETVSVIKSVGSQGSPRLDVKRQLNALLNEGKKYVKLRYILSLVFPAKDNIYKSYPFCKEHHYPYVLAWFHRAVRIPFKHGRTKRFIKRIRNVRKADK